MAEPKLSIAGREYLLSSLSPEARSLCAQLQYCDERTQQLQMELAVLATARQAAAQSLVNLLQGPTESSPAASKPVEKDAGKSAKLAAPAAKKAVRAKAH